MFTKPDMLTALALIGLPTTERRFKHWKHTGQLTPAGTTETGETLYTPRQILNPASDAC
jgi:hypothetical protein